MNDLALGARLVHRALRYRWKLNRREIGAMLEVLPRGGTTLDVGAHKGAYAWWMARRVGTSGHVYAFEPQERVVAPTARAFRSLGMAQVRIVHGAVSDSSGEAQIAVRRSSTHGASLDGLQGDDVESVRVPKLALDDFAAHEKLDRVDFIKIDVEGHELRVLAGAKTIIERFRPRMLVEIEARHQPGADDPVAAAAALLAPLGYRVDFFTARGRRPLSEFRPAEHQNYGHGYYSNNFFFEPRPA